MVRFKMNDDPNAKLEFMSFEEVLNESMKDPEFKRIYEELRLRKARINAVREARAELKISQAELAQRIHTKQASISRFENGQINPTLEFLDKVADAMGMRIEIKLVPK